jgi:hypothetical protein
MAKRLYSTFYDLNGAGVTVDIYDADFVGSATEFTTKTCQITYDSNANDDLSSPIIGSRAKVGMVIPVINSILTTFVEDFATAEEDRFTIEIGKSSGPDVVWRGILVPDFTGEEDTAPSFIFNLSAVCGLGLLKKKPYHDGSAIYTGIDRFTEHLTTALSKLAHTDGFWGGSDVFLKTAVDWWAASMASGATDDAMFQGGVDHAAFYDYGTQGNVDKDVISCYDVVWHILKTFECRIFQIDGSWWIEQISYRTSSSYYTRHYSKTGGYLSNATNSGVNTIDQTKTGAKVATVNYDFLPSLKRAEVTYDVKSLRNFLAGSVQNSGNFDTLISSNSGAATMNLRFTMTVTVTNNGSPLGAGQIYYLIPEVTLKVGDNYLSRDYTITNFTAQTGPLSWESSGTIAMPILMGTIPNTTTTQKKVTFDMILPALPDDGSDNYFGVPAATATMTKQSGGPVDETDFTISVDISSRFLEIFDDGTPIVNDLERLYISENTNIASEVYATKIRLGTTGFPNAAGRVMRWTGTDWVAVNFFGQGVDTRNKELGDVLAKNLLNSRSTPRRRLNGTIFGTVNPKKLLSTTDGKKWMFSNATWDLGLNSLQGTWFELNYGATGVNSTPIKIKVIPSGGTFEPAPPSGGISNTSPGFNANPPPTVLAPVAYNGLDGEIAEGATVTSIPIKIASLGNEFLAGDGVTLVNPITGQFQTFEIASAPAFGATSLSVTSEVATNAFPEDSYLVVKQNAYAFSLPSATQGQILRYNDTTDVWEAYSGTTDGHVLTWDTTNGWQSEAAAGGGSAITALTGDVTATGPGSVAATIANNAVTTVKILDANVTTAKIADSAVTAAKIASNAVTTVKILDSNVTTAKIADDAVTLAKLQNAVAANIVLGNIGAAGAIYTELTAANLYTLLSILNGLVDRVPYFTAANAMTASGNFKYFSGVKELNVGGGISLDGRFVHRDSANITGNNSAFIGSNSVEGVYSMLLQNTKNVAAASTKLQLFVGGTAVSSLSGDPFIEFVVQLAGNTWTVGVDNSDGDKFKITPKSTAPGSVGNSGLSITSEEIAKVGINKDAPAYDLDVSGQSRAKQFMVTNVKPTAGAAGNGLGTGGAIGVITGADNAFVLPFATGSAGLVAGGAICTITYSKAWPIFAVPVFSASNDITAEEISKFTFGTFDHKTFSIKVRSGQTLTASKEYQLNFNVGGQG